MQAISLAESGRWDKSSRSHFAWPWTVMAHGKGRFFPSKAAAIAAVRRLQADGLKNIDVGSMQVNLKYHPEGVRQPQRRVRSRDQRAFRRRVVCETAQGQ
jgi:hypothetical protein